MVRHLNRIKNTVAFFAVALGAMALTRFYWDFLWTFAAAYWPVMLSAICIGGGIALQRFDARAYAERRRAAKNPQTYPLTEEDSKASRTVAAWHEAGHVIAGRYSHDGIRRVIKAQIWPDARGGYAGMATFWPDKPNATCKDLEFQIRRHLGGKAAEELALGQGDIGADTDMWNATHLAQNMVGRYGMSKAFGRVRYDLTRNSLSSREMRLLHSESVRILEEQMAETKKVLLEHKEELKAVAGALFQRKFLNEQDILKLLEPVVSHS